MIKPGDIMWHRIDVTRDDAWDEPYLVIEIMDSFRDYWGDPHLGVVRFLSLIGGDEITLEQKQVAGLVKDGLVYIT